MLGRLPAFEACGGRPGDDAAVGESRGTKGCDDHELYDLHEEALAVTQALDLNAPRIAGLAPAAEVLAVVPQQVIGALSQPGACAPHDALGVGARARVAIQEDRPAVGEFRERDFLHEAAGVLQSTCVVNDPPIADVNAKMGVATVLCDEWCPGAERSKVGKVLHGHFPHPVSDGSRVKNVAARGLPGRFAGASRRCRCNDEDLGRIHATAGSASGFTMDGEYRRTGYETLCLASLRASPIVGDVESS